MANLTELGSWRGFATIPSYAGPTDVDATTHYAPEIAGNAIVRIEEHVRLLSVAPQSALSARATFGRQPVRQPLKQRTVSRQAGSQCLAVDKYVATHVTQ
jgi:hypothetical protein